MENQVLGARGRRDVVILFATRAIRMFAYGLISIVLALYLEERRLADWQIGLIFGLTMAGDTVISLWLTTHADRFGRKPTLVVGSALVMLAAAVFATTGAMWLLILAAIVGVISPNGKEVGPFLAVEQAALSDVVGDARRTAAFGWYNVAGFASVALGSLVAGGLAASAGYRSVVLLYGALGLLMALLFLFLSPGCEVRHRNNGPRPKLGLHKSRKVVLKLSALFSLDAFGGGFIMQTLVAYWFFTRYGVGGWGLGAVFFFAELLAAASALAAVGLAKRIGLINTMFYTHLPSNVLVILFPLMPNAGWAIAIWLLRCSISQMDVPTRQSYTMAVVDPDERSAAGGVANVARTVGNSISPVLWGLVRGSGLLAVPFFLSGGLKILYDVLLFQNFRRLPAPEEAAKQEAAAR